MDRARRRGATWLFTAAAFVYLADRFSKGWAEAELPGHPIEVIPGVLTFRFATNPGGAFSLGQDLPWFFVIATISVSAVIVLTAFRHTKPVTAVALGLVLGGALGNLTDRIVRGPGFSGHVVDFIDLQVWPVFNLADSAIVIGALVLAFRSFAGDHRESSVPAEGEPAADER
ncbi:MAG: signal peptidase II [Actinomycetota bacterium]